MGGTEDEDGGGGQGCEGDGVGDQVDEEKVSEEQCSLNTINYFH